MSVEVILNDSNVGNENVVDEVFVDQHAKDDVVEIVVDVDFWWVMYK